MHGWWVGIMMVVSRHGQKGIVQVLVVLEQQLLPLLLLLQEQLLVVVLLPVNY